MIPFPPFPSLPSLCLSLPFPSVIIFFFHMIGGFDVFLTSRNIITHRPFGVRRLYHSWLRSATAVAANYRSIIRGKL